jgi:arylsulfatase A-like enzyme
MIDTLAKVANSKNSKTPFMITLFTTTNHTPFRIPEEYEQYFKHIKTGDKNFLRAKKTMAYNDLVLKDFFDIIKNEEWYKNTIFIITADHGLSISRDIPIHPRNGHIPFIIFSDLIDTSIKVDKIVSQVDIMPTLIDLMGEDQYLSNFYGISGLRGGSGFACRVSSNNLQWVTSNNIYHQIMGQDKIFYLKFDNIWDKKYKELNLLDSKQSMIESNAYIKNAYHKFKNHNY